MFSKISLLVHLAQIMVEETSMAHGYVMFICHGKIPAIPRNFYLNESRQIPLVNQTSQDIHNSSGGGARGNKRKWRKAQIKSYSDRFRWDA